MAFRRKYFFFDIDGTLVPKAGGTEIPAGTKAAMEELRRQGHFLAIATGRSQFLASGLCRELGFENMVSDGGNGIVLEGKLIGIEPLPRHLCLELAAQCEARGFSWAVSPENSDIRLTKDSRFADRAGSYYMKTVVKPDLEIESSSPGFVTSRNISLWSPQISRWACAGLWTTTRRPMRMRWFSVTGEMI